MISKQERDACRFDKQAQGTFYGVRRRLRLVHCHKTDENLGPSDSIVGQEQYLLM